MQKKRKLPIYAVLSIAFLVFCSTGFLLAPNDPKALTLEAKLLSPCMSYPFGTDELGRCIFSRILMGGYVTLGMALWQFRSLCCNCNQRPVKEGHQAPRKGQAAARYQVEQFHRDQNPVFAGVLRRHSQLQDLF